MKLTRLSIQQLPGIDSPFTLEGLDPGVNLVTGPNAIGKSSLIRALRYLVSEPAGSDPAALSLSADFANGGHWRVSRTGRGYEWHHDGQQAERPPLPDRDALHYYWLTMENLVQSGKDDDQLVEQLRQALSGGYDLPALRSGEFELRPRIGTTEGGNLRNARTEQRRVESEYSALRQREATLPILEDHIEQARKAGVRVRHLDEALALLKILTEKSEIRTALAGFPSHMAKLRGNEQDRLTQLQSEHEQLQREIELAVRSHQDAGTTFQSTQLAEARPAQRELQTQRKLLDDIEHRRDQLNDKQEARDQALARESVALRTLGGNDTPPQLTPSVIQRAETLATELTRIQLQCAETEARLQTSDKAPDEGTLTRYRQGIQALLDWLAVQQGGTGRKISALVAGIAGGVAAIAALFAQAWIAAAAAVIAMGASILSLREKGSDASAEARRNFEKQALDGPAEWKPASVQKALQALQQRFDELRLKHQKALASADDSQRLQRLQADLQQKEEEKQQLAQEIGFDPGLTALGVDHFVRRVQDYQQALQQRQGLEHTIGQLEQTIHDGLVSVRKFLAAWRIDVAATLAELNAALADLTERTRRAEEQLAVMTQLDRELLRLRHDAEERKQQIADLYQEAGLQPDDRQALESGIEQLDAWKAQRQRLQENSLRESQGRETLADDAALITRAEDGDRQILEQEREQAQAEAEELERLLEERAQINTDVRSAGGNRLLEAAGARVDEAGAALEDRMNEQLFAEAGQFLLEEVESEHRTEHEPEVLRDARERFRGFTHHAWDLQLSDNRLCARDLKQSRLRELAELSSGTRMQMLLALRLAWTLRLERSHEPLPLFLDEALTTADEKRFAAVADSLETLARQEGRQVFYLSARRQEVTLWEKVTGRRPHHIDLASIRRVRESAMPEDYALADETPLPVPGNRTPEAYATELAVPPAAPMQEATEFHLFHLLRDDLNLLYILMQNWNVITLGQLEALLDSPSAGKAIPDEQLRHRLLGRCRAAKVWASAWQRGRGKRVDRIILEQSEAVSDNYIDEVTNLAEKENGDAQAIIDALQDKQVSGFRKNKMEELQEYFLENGYISQEQVLDADGRERQTLLMIGHEADPADIRHLLHWLEANLRQTV